VYVILSISFNIVHAVKYIRTALLYVSHFRNNFLVLFITVIDVVLFLGNDNEGISAF